MKILLCTENHFPGYGGPYTAISQTAQNLYKRGINFKLIFERTDQYKYNLVKQKQIRYLAEGNLF